MLNKLVNNYDAKRLYRCAALLVLILAPFCLYSLYWYQTSNRLSLLLLISMFLVIMIALVIPFGLKLLNSMKATLVGYAISLTFFSLLFVFLFPPLTVADEDHHFAATYWMANCVMGTGSWDDSSTLLMRPEDASLLFEETDPHISESSYRTILDNAQLFSNGDEPISIDIDEHFTLSVNGDNFVTKIPSIIGVVLARTLNLGAYPLFYLGRIFSCLAFVACCILAVKITPVAKGAFIVASLLPMSLNLAASYSYDCGIIALSFLFLASVLKGIFDGGKLTKIDLALIAIPAVLLAPCKVIYSLELVLLFMIPAKRFTSKRAELLFKLSVIALSAAFIVALRLTFISSLAAGSTSRYSSEGTSISLGYLIQHPIQTGTLFFRTVIEQGDFYIQSAIGSMLGWLQGDLSAPNYFVIAYILCAAYSVQVSIGDSIEITFRYKLIFVLITSGILFASMLALLLDWTSLGATIIQGVQGRYLLPTMPLLFMLLRYRAGKVETNVLPFSFTCMFVLNALYTVQFFARTLLLVQA